VSIDDLVRYLIQGIPIGCVYGLVAIGLVLGYKTSGVFNLAFGAQAFLSAAVFYDTRRTHDWPLWASFLLAVMIVGPLVGLVLDRFLFRFMRTASWQVKLVSALGLLVGVPEVIKLWFGDAPKFKPPGLAPDPERVYRLSDYTIRSEELATVIVTGVVVVLLGLLFRYTPIGLQMRAVVESARMVELAGIDSERVGAVAWMLSSFLAGLAGVMLAPLFATLEVANFFTLIVVAITAAAFGRLSSIPLTLAGALALGVLQQAIAGELPNNSILARNIRPSLPFLALFLLLLFWPGLRRQAAQTDPLAGVDPPAPALAVSYQDQRLRRVTRYLMPAFVAAVVISALTWLSDLWVFRLTDAIVLTVLLLSITVVTGMSGQVSLAQASFAGIGAFTTANLAAEQGLSPIPAMFVGAAVAAAFGVALAVPALRLGGLYLTLATLAFGLMADAVLFPLEQVSGGQQGLEILRPTVGPWDLGGDRAFFLLAMAVFALAGFVVVLVRKGSTGQSLAALRGSETAAASVGIDPVRARITVFALSAAIAGLGGGLYAMYVGTVSPSEFRFNALFGLVYVVLVVTLGARTVDGAVNAGIGFVFFPILLDNLGLEQSIAIIAFGFGALTYARHPEGIVEFRKRASIEAQVRAGVVRERARALAERGAQPREWHPVARDVLLTAVTLGLYVPVFAARAHHELRRREGVGLPPVLVLLLGLPLVAGAVVAWRAPEELGIALALVLVGATTFFLLPERIERAAPRAGWRSSVGARSGLGPTFFVALTVYIRYKTTTATEPTTLGEVFPLVVAAILVLVWVSQVQGALDEHWVTRAEGAPRTEAGGAPGEEDVERDQPDEVLLDDGRAAPVPEPTRGGA